MAKVLVAFYNGVSDEKNPSAMPVFYEAFIQGLDRAGNQVMVYSHAAFGIDFGEIDIQTRDSILNFEPDLCIVFNNCFYDLAEVVECPIIIYEVDSPRYFSNKENIRRNPERYLYFIFQEDSRAILKENFEISDNRIFYAPFFRRFMLIQQWIKQQIFHLLEVCSIWGIQTYLSHLYSKILLNRSGQ